MFVFDNILELSRGEICVANLKAPREWCQFGQVFNPTNDYYCPNLPIYLSVCGVMLVIKYYWMTFKTGENKTCGRQST